MGLSNTDLAKYIYDPMRVQQTIFDTYTESTNGEFFISEPTNPFVNLLEAAAVIGSNSMVGSDSVSRRLYPNLANTPDELMHHISDDELANMFSVPSEANIVFYLNVKDLKSMGFRPADSNYVETVLPIGTEVSVTGITFSLLNDILVRIYDSGIVFAEQLLSSEDITVNNLGVLPSGIVSFQDGVPWIVIETTLKQVKRHTITKSITTAEGFNEKVIIEDQYFASRIGYKNETTNNKYLPIPKTHSKDYITANTPTVQVSLGGNEIGFKIPDVYLVNGYITGSIELIIYETKGSLYLPINKYKMEEFNVNVPTISNTTAGSTIGNMTILASSRDIVDGGSNGYTLDQIKESIIKNTLGDIDLPLTTYQLKKTGEFEGFEILKSLDVATKRTYVANKVLPDLKTDLIYAKPDIYFNTYRLILDQVSEIPNAVVNGDYVMIPGNTLFKEENGVISVVTAAERSYIDSLGNGAKVTYFSNNRLFFNPFYYVTDINSLNKTESRIYDLDNPSMRDIKITGKNTNLIERVNTSQYGIYKTDTGYRVTISLVGNSEFNASTLSLVRGQLSLPLYGGTEAHFKGEYNAVTNLIHFDIDTNLFIDDSNRLFISNGVTTISNTLTDLLTTGKIYLYTLDPTIVDNTKYLISSIVDVTSTPTVFSVETITIEFGKHAKYIWDSLYNTYTTRKYLTYENDVPAYYEEDVYQLDPATGSIVTATEVDGVITLSSVLLHNKGDIKLDTDGTPILLHRRGDIVLDSDGVPTIDKVSGVIRNLDIMMLEYEFSVANTTVYKNYLNTVLDTIRNWVFVSTEKINVKLLENTTVKFKSYRTSEPVTLLSNNTNINVPYVVKPVVTIYTTAEAIIGYELELLHTTVGTILHKHLDNRLINLVNIKNEIMDKTDVGIVGVKITGLDGGIGSEIFDVVSVARRLALRKTLVITDNNELVVNYAIDFNIHSVKA